MWQQSWGGGDGQHILLLQHQDLQLSSSSPGSTSSVMQSFHLQWKQKHNHQNHWGMESIKKLWDELASYWNKLFSEVMKMPCMKTSSAPDMFLLVCQHTNKEGLETILLHHWKHYRLLGKGTQTITSGHPEASLGSQCAWPPLGTGTQCSSCIPLCVRGQA